MSKVIAIMPDGYEIHKPRTYTGMIQNAEKDAEYLTGIDTKKPQTFVQNGNWIAYGNREIGSYQICDEDGQEIEAYEHLQFSRTRDNRFFLETVG